MALRLRGLGLSAIGLVVTAFIAQLSMPSDAGVTGTSSGIRRADRVIPTAQKKVPKKKFRGKRPTSKTAVEGNESEKPAAESTTTPAADDGTLKFSRDIAPIIVANCSGCHNPRQKRGKLDMSTFEKMMEGTPKEKVIAPGKPEESHLVMRIKGEETPKMPQGGNRNLSEAAISKIEQWVKAGAVLDAGIDAKKPMESYAASPEDLRKAELAKMPADKRDKQVEAVGRERWKKASPKTSPEVTTGTHFLMFSTLPKDRAAAALKAVESQFPAVRGLLGAKALEWGEKGSLFVFNDAASYGEFVKANENREVEAAETGTSRFTVPQPYVAVNTPSVGRDEPAAPGAPAAPKRARAKRGADDEPSVGGGGDRTLAGLLTEQFVIGVASRAGKPPRWVSLGLAAMVASRVEKGSSYYKKIRKEALGLCELGWASKANDALGDATKTEEVRAVGFAVMEWLASEDRSLPASFATGMLAGGEKLDDVIQNVLNGSREDFLRGSSEFVTSHYGR